MESFENLQETFPSDDLLSAELLDKVQLFFLFLTFGWFDV